MKQRGKNGILLACALLAAVRLAAPEWTEAVRSEALRFFGWRDGAAAETLEGLGEQTAEALGRTDDTAIPVLEPRSTRHSAGQRSGTPEDALVTGEFNTSPTAAPESTEPPAVAAFLESQAAYSELPLPANVDYGYQPLPFAWTAPVAGLRSSGFGFRTHPIQQVVKFHYGTDLAANNGDDILAFADGTVSAVGWDGGYGNYLIVDHGDGWQSLSAHCSAILVTSGQTVRKGETIARVGATGRVTGPHRHFELTKDGVYRNPEYYING